MLKGASLGDYREPENDPPDDWESPADKDDPDDGPQRDNLRTTSKWFKVHL